MVDSFNLKEDLEYPTFDNQGKNPQIVRLLYNLYASDTGELNAVLQYSYQYSVLKKEHNETARLLKALSLVNMQYLELLANSIIQFGGLPYYINSRGKAYCTKDVFYCTNVLHILKRDILDTKSSLQLYMQTINRIRNVSLKRLLSRIAEEKRLQIVALEVAYQRELKDSQLNPRYDQNNFDKPHYDNAPNFDNMPHYDDFSHDECYESHYDYDNYNTNYEDDDYHDCNCGDQNYRDAYFKDYDYDMQKLDNLNAPHFENFDANQINSPLYENDAINHNDYSKDFTNLNNLKDSAKFSDNPNAISNEKTSNAPDFLDMNNQENKNFTPTLFGE